MRALALLAILFIPMTAGAWTEMHGDAGNTGQLGVSSGPGDITGIHRMLPEGTHMQGLPSHPWMQTEAGLMTVARADADDACIIAWYDVDAMAGRSLPVPGCYGAYPQGVRDDLLLFCGQGPPAETGVWAVHIDDGAVAWHRTYAELGILGTETWACFHGSIESEGNLVLPIGTSRTAADLLLHRIISLDVGTGDVNWETVIPAYAVLDAALPAPGIDGSGANLMPLSITSTDTGYVAIGAYLCNEPGLCNSIDEPVGNIGFFAAWIGGGGVPNGMIKTTLDPNEDPQRSETVTSFWATAHNQGATFLMGAEIVTVDPLATSPLSRTRLPAAAGSSPGSLAILGPSNNGDLLFVPHSGVTAFRVADRAPQWSVSMDDGWGVPMVAITGRDIWIGAQNSVGASVNGDLGATISDQLKLARHRGSDGTLLQELVCPLLVTSYAEPFIELPFDQGFLVTWNPAYQFVPAARGFLVHNQLGDGCLIEPTDPASKASFAIDGTYAAASQPVSLTRDPSDPTEVRVAWGDGDRDVWPAGEPVLEHVYETEGTFQAFFTAHYEDGTTQTTTHIFRIGEEPLNSLQRAFAPGNQDLTFGLLGVALVVLGAIASLVARRIGRGRIAAGLRDLATIRADADEDAFSALRELQSWHDRQENRLLRGRITEDQFRVLEDRAARLLRSLTDVVLEPVADALGVTVRRKLEAAYRDGFVDRIEVESLRRAVEPLELSSADRRLVEDVLDAWS